MNNVLMTIYRDSTGLFTSEECDQDNEFNTYVPYNVLFEYFMDNVKGNFPAADPHEGITDEGLFDEWLDEYTMDATNDLYDYCKAKGVELTEYMAPMRIYAYDIWSGDKGIIVAKTYKEAVEEYRECYDAPLDDDGYDYDEGVCRIDYVGTLFRQRFL